MINIFLTVIMAVICLISFVLYFRNEANKAEKVAKKPTSKNKKKEQKENPKEIETEEKCFFIKHYKVLIIAVLLIGVLVRSAFYWEFPRGLNQDEASVCYDTYADVKYGFDRNGDHNPVYSVAWGSGHSSLYITLSKPFMALFGLNMFTARIVNVLFSCIALFAFYGILKRLLSKKGALLGTFIFAICPWHIMMARWALECNLFPNVFIIATFFLVRGFTNQKFYIPSLFIYGLCLYAYGTSYMIVPSYLLVMAIYLLIHKKISWKMLVLCMGVFIVTAIPIMLFMAVNMFGAPEMDFGFMSVPKLINGRYNTTVTVLGGNFLAEVGKNLKTFFSIIFTQNDRLIYNVIPAYGTIYQFSVPFMLSGVIIYFMDMWKGRKKFNPAFVVVAMTVSMFILGMLSQLNVNRANFIFIPLTLFTIYGIIFVIKNIKFMAEPTVGLYIIAFCMFVIYYFSPKYQVDQVGWSFSYGFGEAVQYASENAEDDVYMTTKVHAPYIKALFFTKTEPQVFLDTVDYEDPNRQVRQVRSFDRYYTGVPEVLPEGDNAYIFSNGEYRNRTDFNKEDYETKVFGHYTVMTKK